MAARDIAKKPRMLEIVKILSELPAKPAIIAPVSYTHLTLPTTPYV